MSKVCGEAKVGLIETSGWRREGEGYRYAGGGKAEKKCRDRECEQGKEEKKEKEMRKGGRLEKKVRGGVERVREREKERRGY